jgi:two-component system response regulator YesN
VDYLKENRHLLKGKLFEELIWGDGDKLPELRQKMAELEINIEPACFMLMVLSVKGHRSLSTEFLKEKYEILGLKITGKIQTILHNHGTGEVFYNTAGEYVIILSQNTTNSEYAFVQGAFMLFDRIAKDMRDELDVSIIGGLSTTGHGMESLRELYGQASSAASCHFIRGTGRLVAYNDINWRGVLKTEFVNQKVELMKGLLKGLDLSGIRDGAALLKINSENVGIEDIGTIRELFDKYYYYLNDYAQTHNVLKVVQPQLKQYASELRHNGTLNELNNWITNLVTKIGESLFGSNQLLKQAKNYIDQHFSEDISLCSVAAALGVSSSYLSRVFIKEGEGGFSDYLAKVRIQTAIEYIRNSNMKIYEIAEAVGYPNPENFARMFRKRVGRSPKQFFK